MVNFLGTETYMPPMLVAGMCFNKNIVMQVSFVGYQVLINSTFIDMTSLLPVLYTNASHWKIDHSEVLPEEMVSMLPVQQK
jgi:hypothetical protein